MKRAGYLLDKIAARGNLAEAFRKAARGKQTRPEVRLFQENLEDNLAELRRGILDGDVPVGNYFSFRIHDPKPRTICAAVFSERVLHHAIMNLCEPIFERRAIFDSYACRKGKGRLAAVQRAADFAKHSEFFLKMDMRAYFDSIDQVVLRGLLARLFKDCGLLQLFDRIIGAYETAPGKGLPIGNLTSQFFANHYLEPFDRFVKEQLRCRSYVRYMDDVGLWSDDRKELKMWRDGCREFLRAELKQELKPEPFINRTLLGMDFLGYRIFPMKLGLTRRSRTRFRRKLARYEAALEQDEMSEQDFQSRVTALTAFISHAESAAFRRFVFGYSTLEDSHER